MFDPSQYELLDFGEGRKLERFGAYLLDRPAPAAELASKELSPIEWQSAVCYRRTSGDRGDWIWDFPLPGTWCIGQGKFTFELKPNEFGHVGIFPEQAENWNWIAAQIRRAERPLKVLNLFAYTGGSTIAAAAAGAKVVHVDSAANVVAWARQNAALSGLVDAPIRWIVEDAEKFVRRELKRGNRYDAVILDPPSYGHGPKGEVWRLGDGLPGLLADCVELTGGQARFLLLSCHSLGWGSRALGQLLADVLDGAAPVPVAGELEITTSDDRRLPCGFFARVGN